ncbi:hypothetical protein CYY_003267 [Polysphondylium violaceum]|uniref:BTB domain-containing protein n=1 Tax=Polysphondylium violaceum TaxID=133409 RepID=A0A8J4PV13_9MYCE|nr:hypothetical protein CYY_003267 [Polysphondylium violaceum]
MIKLNIGGKKFCTTKETLLSSQSTFFVGLLGGKFGNYVDEKGYYFIDRDGELFAPILGFMRTGELIIPDSMPMERIIKEIDYYGIESLLSFVNQRTTDTPNMGETYFISRIKSTLTKNSDGTSCKIDRVLVKANILILYFSNNTIDIWIYKGITFHWIKLLSFSSPLESDLKGMICSISKHSINNQTYKIILSIYSNNTVVSYKIYLDYMHLRTNQFEEIIKKLEHNIDFIHFFLNTFYLACISKDGFITIFDVSNFESKALNISNNQKITQIGQDIDHSLFFGTDRGIVYGVKQSPQRGWGWIIEEIYKLNDPEFFLSSFGYSSSSGGNGGGGSSSPSMASKFENILQLNNFNDGQGDQEYITFITGCSVKGTTPKLLMAIGTHDGHIHFAHKSLSGNDKFQFAAKFCVGINDPITKIILTEGVLVTGQTEKGVVKTYQYLLKNKLSGPATQCVSARHSHHFTNCTKSIYYSDILLFKIYTDLHFASQDYQALLGNIKSTVEGKSDKVGGRKKLQYNQMSVMVDTNNTLFLFPNSQKSLKADDMSPIYNYQAPIAKINLIDLTPVTNIVCVTFGGCEPNLNDQSYQLLTIHESLEIYCWDLKEIDKRFV